MHAGQRIRLSKILEFHLVLSCNATCIIRYEKYRWSRMSGRRTSGSSRLAKRPAPYRSLLGPSGPKCVSRGVSLKTGVSKGVSHGVFPGSLGPRAPECPKSVPRVSLECPKHLLDTLGTLSGQFLDTPECGPRRALGTPRGTLPWTPPFSGTLSGTLPGTLWARRAQKTPVGGRTLRNSRPSLGVQVLAVFSGIF